MRHGNNQAKLYTIIVSFSRLVYYYTTYKKKSHILYSTICILHSDINSNKGGNFHMIISYLLLFSPEIDEMKINSQNKHYFTNK